MFRQYPESFTIRHEPDRMARGRYSKGKGFNRGLRTQRTPVRGDALITSERAMWLRPERS